ncbi:hypothetical protein ACOMHN_042873 [Nucella lapillus]
MPALFYPVLYPPLTLDRPSSSTVTPLQTRGTKRFENSRLSEKLDLIPIDSSISTPGVSAPGGKKRGSSFAAASSRRPTLTPLNPFLLFCHKKAQGSCGAGGFVSSCDRGPGSLAG